MALKDNIKSQRIRCGLTLEELAQKVGVSRQTIQRYESGVISNIPSDNIEKIADALDTTPSYLMGWIDSPYDEDKYDEYINPHFNGDPNKQRDFDKTVYEDVLKESNPLVIPDDEIEVRAIQRAAKKMTPQDRKKMLQIIKLSFEDAFSEDE